MERLDVIERVYEPTDWVNSMVTVIKDCIYGLPHISVETDHKPLESILR